MRFGILSDLHLGGSGYNCWHNPIRYDLAEELALESIRCLNRESLDAVIVLGDITEHGLRSELELAKGILSHSRAPWLAIPGNHDLPMVASGEWEQCMDGHSAAQYRRNGAFGFLAVNSFTGFMEDAPPDWRLGEPVFDSILGEVAGDREPIGERPPILIVLSHVPLLSVQSEVDRNGGKYAGHHADGPELVQRLRAATGSHVVILSGHLHMHHIESAPGVTQCLTGALAEYPGEYRIIEITRERLTYDVGRTRASDALFEASGLTAWPAGRTKDRSGALDLIAA